MKRLDAFIVAIVLFAAYAASAPRTVMMEDDGNFILASAYLGIAHPPGYPLFTLFGKLATLLPLGSVAYRVHLLSALFGALTCALVWLCAQELTRSWDKRGLAAWLAALGLGFSPVFWSQSIIAEVYTLNTLFLFGLLCMALRNAPLPAMALVFGLSLANHYPLMLLCAPGLAVLLWPRRAELLARLPLAAALFAAGLLPYAWMVWRSHAPLPISFAGPLESVGEFWFFVSRAGYAELDASHTAGWLDRARYLRFIGAELLRVFAIAGTALAAIGFWAQWRMWGTRIAAALTLVFAMPSVVLVFVLGFDYDAFHKHVFHVYPLPAYGVAALWMALGAARIGGRIAVALGAVALALIGAVGLYFNYLTDYRWVERYAQVLLDALPKDADVLLKGADTGPLAYFHMVEERRPDITLYQADGLVLGNRLFHPYRTDKRVQQVLVRDLVAAARGPVATTAPPLEGFVWREHWLFATREMQSGVEISPSMQRFFQEDLAPGGERSAYIEYYKGELRRRYAALVAQAAAPGQPLDALHEDFATALGAAEGLLANPRGYDIRQAAAMLERVAAHMPSDASKRQQARFFELRGYLRLQAGDRRGGIADLEFAAALWPVPENGAARALKDLPRS